jgi:hypothetical protein
MSTQTQPGTPLGLPLTWTEFEAVPILFGNHFLVQHQPDEFVLSVGQWTGPPLVGSRDEVERQASELSGIPVETLAHVAMTRRRVTELIAVLQAALEDHDRVLGA